MDEHICARYYECMRKDIIPTYNAVKDTIIESENFDPLKESYLAPFNEFRNVLDHIIKGVFTDDIAKLESQLDQAIIHLNRAGYDVYEVFASNLGIAIHDIMNPFSLELINSVFPEYTQFRISILDIQDGISNVRKKKDLDNETKVQPFEEYKKNVGELKEIYKKVIQISPLLLEEEAKIKRKHSKKTLTGLALAITGGIIVVIIGIFLGVLFDDWFAGLFNRD